ncbi:PHP domain-containing protein [Nocardiopsis composta]|uniref:PHP domain-containing protein n=1 Tax=Nocardiopsis composta TaxID=157465 RepID=UPI0031DEA029
MTRIDLHTHSSVSDGTEPPAEVVARARAAGVDVFALTDHDTAAGLKEAAAALPPGLTLVPGMELSCAYRGSSVHLACYLFDPEAPSLAAELRRIRDDRVNRAKEMVRLLRAAGVGVTWEQVRDIALNGGGDGELEAGVVVGRPHIARAIGAAGAAEDVQDAFDRWIGSGGPAYAARYALDPVRAVRAVREAGGVCSLAHPARAEGTLTGAVPVELAERMVRAGLGGIEADHPSHDEAETERWRGIARDLGVAVTGSSDDHGALTGHRIGVRTTAPEEFARLIEPATGAEPVTG